MRNIIVKHVAMCLDCGLEVQVADGLQKVVNKGSLIFKIYGLLAKELPSCECGEDRKDGVE